MSDWFLPAGRSGSPDEWCFQTVPTAELRVYTDYFAYYDRLGSLISQATKPNHEIFLIGWAFDLGETLKGTSALNFLAARAQKSRVRLLAPPSHSGFDNAKQVSDAVDKKVQALIDDHLPKLPHPEIKLHHQKAVFIKLESNSHLFVGGMDIAMDRIDQWFDVQVEIIGLGAALGRKTMEERWESLKPPVGGLSALEQPIIPSGKGDAHQVQFVRTYPPFPKDRTNWKRNFAEKGDHTYYSLICHAIAKAKTSIYLEDQMFFKTGPPPVRNNPAGGSSPRERSDVPDVPHTLEHLLQEALGRNVKLVVIGSNWNDPRRKEVLNSLSHATNPPVLLRHVLPTDMFVHSKTWIFDDEFVVVGSANFWDQSFLSVNIPAESEFGVAFISKADGAALGFPNVPFAKALRRKLWERIRQEVDVNYKWPRNLTEFDDEVRELKTPSAGGNPFAPM